MPGGEYWPDARNRLHFGSAVMSAPATSGWFRARAYMIQEPGLCRRFVRLNALAGAPRHMQCRKI
ncbi:MAG: hypothetical protein WBF58_02670, partial [Xanthobacteraceae bacterium]